MGNAGNVATGDVLRNVASGRCDRVHDRVVDANENFNEKFAEQAKLTHEGASFW